MTRQQRQNFEELSLLPGLNLISIEKLELCLFVCQLLSPDEGMVAGIGLVGEEELVEKEEGEEKEGEDVGADFEEEAAQTKD